MGNDLFSKVTGLTGLPEELIGNELKDLLEKKGISPEECTMDSLRAALEDYLKDVNAQMLAEGVTDADGETTGEDADSDSVSDELTQ